MRIAVFCGSADGREGSGYKDAAFRLGVLLAERGIELVYGGARVGLMGAVASGALSVGGRVVGVLPRGLAERELAHPELTELRMVETMHQRKAEMCDLADGFIALPGGVGTFEEIFEVWCWGQLGLHRKPFGLLNIDGYYEKLVAFIRHSSDEGFVRPEYVRMLQIADDAETMLDAFERYRAPADKWS
ncbi:cytokinin riboside 5'-monophosphate phosphoribohydrolase [Marinobacterium nitratireducens]|uniref:Cytokinin riboside 5'-monophosphate phosphoribohydrolase n=1 Tax=Marinobacterium nitratireducens TaxID=518897 RepID=A0A918DWK6_9GAMM|nr:TIGR00730 family Rossman fold protein [Marinobacterium nitratireducens]GGO85863.1 cytokinin riboside 5'-monophosphate phosphoribohydrolase [Marinobacterium nitratireducens]